MKLHTIDTGYFKLDGGAMFGVVPKKMWQKLNPPDEANMCTWAMRCLLVEDGDRKILIDTGLGNKQDEKFRSHFSPHGTDTLLHSIGRAGFAAEDITDVLLTHLHFDHVGGAVYRNDQGRLLPTFPNATYWTNEPHLQWALDPNPRERASFLKENILPLQDHGCLRFIDVEAGVRFSDHITLEFGYGHTEAMMVPFIGLANGKTLVYTADLLPSHGHTGLPYVMAYDIRPLTTMKERAALYERVANPDHYIYFEHDKDIAVGQLSTNEKGRVVFDKEVEIGSILP